MSEAYTLREFSKPKTLYMIVGWRQWADAGAVSSSLPLWLAQTTDAHKIGSMKPDGFYLFQIPGTHDLVRPVIRFEDGYPHSLDTHRNDFYYTGDDERGVVIFMGDEPHLDAERYVSTLLDIAAQLGVQRILGFAGVYGEIPYDKERIINGIYSLPTMKDALEPYAMGLSDYEGGASIGAYMCRRAGERGQEYIGLYAIVPTYEFGALTRLGKGIRIENDFTAWHGIMRRVNHMLGMTFDLSELVQKSKLLVEAVSEKIDEIEAESPDVGLRAYVRELAADFEELTFDPMENVWAQEIDRLFDTPDEEDEPGDDPAT